MGRTWLTLLELGVVRRTSTARRRSRFTRLGPRSGSARVCEGLPQTSSCALRPHNEIDVTVENLKQGHELIDGLIVVRLIQEPIELGRGSPESADDLTLRYGASRDSLLSLKRQPVEDPIPQVIGVLVVLDHLFDLD